MSIGIDPYKYIVEQKKKNPFFPLPKDYFQLSGSEQKIARMAAITNHKTPLDFVAAWDCFRRLYLFTTRPGFFYHKLKPSPPFHYQAIYDCEAHARNLIGAPRGFAKSIVIGTELPLFLMLTRPYIRIVLCMATDKLVEGRFDNIMNQLTKNDNIVNDFGIQKPKRGDAIWNRRHIQMVNGSRMEGFSVTGRKRGARPDIFILDDPEYDPETDSEEAATMMKQKFETFLFHQVLPMLETHASIVWVGTMIGRRSFLYHAVSGDDPRFDFWNKKVYESCIFDEKNPRKIDTSKGLLWEGKWTAKELELRLKLLGRAAFMAEYQNKPVSAEERVLKIHDLKNEYTITHFDKEKWDSDPLRYVGPITYYTLSPTSRKWEMQEKSAKELYEGMFKIITFDPARGLGPHHDFSCIMVMGIDSENCVWVLDMWMGRAKESTLLNHIYKLGIKWRPRVLGIESVAMQIQLHGSMKILLEERKATGWNPAVVPVDYRIGNKRKSKAERISTLEWRFDAGKIKYPAHMSEVPPVKHLYDQTKDFTYDMAMLRYDDAIDAVAMVHYVLHGQGARNFPTEREPTTADRIRAGELTIAGVPRLSGMNSDELCREDIDALMSRSYNLGNHGHQLPNMARKPYFPRRIRIVRRVPNLGPQIQGV